jgi:hypothetical protein
MDNPTKLYGRHTGWWRIRYQQNSYVLLENFDGVDFRIFDIRGKIDLLGLKF